MIRIFERLVQKEIDAKQKHIRIFAWLLLISFIIGVIKAIRIVIRIWDEKNLSQVIKDKFNKVTFDAVDETPVGV